MSLSANWRQLQLFDFLPINDPNYNSDDDMYSNNTLSCITGTKDYLVISMNNCFIKIISQQFTTIKYYMGYDLDYRISFMKALPKENMVVTLAEKQGVPSILKLWDLNKIINTVEDDKAIQSDNDDSVFKYKYQTQVLINNGDNSFPISCFQFNSNFTCVAIGYTNGKVILIRGDLLRDRGSKQRIIYESPDPITGLQFNEYHELIYVTTTSKILTVPTTGRNQGKPLKILSKRTGVPLNCCTKDPESQELIVGLDSALRYYNHMTKSHSVNFEIQKRSIYKHVKDYLVMICPGEDSSIGTSSRKFTTKVIILDLSNKHVSFSLTLSNVSINHIFPMWNDIYLLSSDGVLYKLHEKPINEQVEIILQRQLFNVAFKLASQSKLPTDTLLKICKLNGEFLYSKQDFDGSIKRFILCLDFYKDESLKIDENEETLNDFIMNIITKFKDASNIYNLTEFLYRLYEFSMANSDNITLLLCCYCKLKMVREIKSFVNDLDLSNNGEDRDDNPLHSLNFPLIINLFKECGYFDEVIKLLHKLNQPDLIVGIQLNDLNNPRKCLNYIKSLSIDNLLLILIEYSKTLLDNLPLETTELLINVFTGKYTPIEGPEMFEFNTKSDSEQKHEVSNNESSLPLNSYKGFLAYLSGTNFEDDQVTVTSTYSEPTYLPPRPSLIFPSFINNPNEFVIFLEACIETFEKYQGNINDKKDLLITLYEMYLTLSQKEPENQESWFNKAKGLINEYSQLLDTPSLLLLSHIYGFNEGEMASKEQNGYEESLFRTAELNQDVKGCFDVTSKYGDSKPELFKLLLKFIVSKEHIFKQVSEKDFKKIINKVNDFKLSTPLELIQILSTTEFTTIGLIKDNLIEIIDRNNQEIRNNEKLIESYESEAIKNSHQITELKNKPFIIQNNRCSACNLKLDFPIVHFKCKHSFHQKCLNDTISANNDILSSKPVCVICVNDIDLIETLRDEQLKSKDQSDLFEMTLRESQDKFKVITNYFGKGVMEEDYIQMDNT